MNELKPCPFCDGEACVKSKATILDEMMEKHAETTSLLSGLTGVPEYAITKIRTDNFRRKPCIESAIIRAIDVLADHYGVSTEQLITPRESYQLVKCTVCTASIWGIEAWNTRYERTCEDISTVHGKFVCDECGCVVHDTSMIDNGGLNYCPDCGAEVSNL